jgi:hypothetical protein
MTAYSCNRLRRPLTMAAATLLLAAISIPTLIEAQSRGYGFHVVAALGDVAPGGGTHEGDFEPQDVNSSGTVVFGSDLSTGGEGLFVSRRGVISQITRAGLPAPGTNTTFGGFGIFTPGGLNDAGDFAFGFGLEPYMDPLGLNAGVWRYSASTRAVTNVLVPGDPAPGGTTFHGAGTHADLNNRGQIVTVGIIDTQYGNCTDPNAPCYRLGRGVYVFDAWNNVTQIVAPGDAAPGSSSTFNDAWDPNINNRGDVVFGGHVAGEDCVGPGGGPSTLGCYESLYLYRASTGGISSIAHEGDAAPGGGNFLVAFNGRLNDGGDASFIGSFAEDLTNNGVFLRTRDGRLIAVARPGDPLPGGTMMNASPNPASHAVDNAGNVAFAAALVTDVNGDNIPDSGVYLWSAGTITTVVKTGTQIPGLGIVTHVNNPFFVFPHSPYVWPGVHLNERGQILTQVIMNDGNTYVVVATPR